MKKSTMHTMIEERTGDDNREVQTTLINAAYYMLAEIAQIPANFQADIVTGYDTYTLPANFVKIDFVLKSDGTPLPKISADDAGTREGYYKRGRSIGFSAISAGSSCLVYGTKYPAKLVNDDDEPIEDIPDYYQLGIIEFASDFIRANEADDIDASVSSFYSAKFNKTRAEFKDYISGQDLTSMPIKDVYNVSH